MAYPDNERFLRQIALLGRGGLFALRGIVVKQASSRSQPLQEILANNRNIFNGEQYFELFPSESEVNADVATWNMSLLILVIQKLFRNDLSRDQRASIRTLKSLRDEVEHAQISLTAADYDTNRADLKEAIKNLASGLPPETQGRIQDAINSTGSAVIDVQTTLQQIRELGEYTPSLLDDLDTVFNTVSLHITSRALNRCNNNQDRASEPGQDSEETKHDRDFSSSFEKLTTTGGRDDNVELNTSEHGLGENVQDATYFEDLKPAATRDDDSQAVHASEHSRDSNKIKCECRGELSSSFEELKPAGIKQCNETTMPKQMCTSNPCEQNSQTVESVNGNVTVKRDGEPAGSSSECQTSGTGESYDHLIELTHSVHDMEDSECHQERRISNEQDISSSGIGVGSFIDVNAFGSDIENQERNQETEIANAQESRIEAVQEENDQWLDYNGHVYPYIRQELFHGLEADDRHGERNIVRAISENQSTEIRDMVRDMIVIQKYGGRSRNVLRELQIRIKIESNIPNLADDADHAVCRIINEILSQVNLVDASQETQIMFDDMQHNSYLAVTNGNDDLPSAAASQQGDGNLLLERPTRRRDNVDEILERVMSNLGEDLERNPDLVRLCFILLLKLSRLGGVHLMSAGKGCVLLMIKCKSIDAVLQLLEFYTDHSFQEILDKIARTLKSQRGGRIKIQRELTRESLENLKHSIEEELQNLPKERNILLRSKCAGTADVCRINRFLETEGKNICRQIEIELSRRVGGDVSLAICVDPLDMKQALGVPELYLLARLNDCIKVYSREKSCFTQHATDSTPDLTDLIGALVPRSAPLHGPIAV